MLLRLFLLSHLEGTIDESEKNGSRMCGSRFLVR